jgi:transcriptional regulator with XRE-family HTH domain
MSLGQHLRFVRTGQGKSLDEVSRTIGCSIGFLSDIENGRRSLSIRRAEQVAKAFGKDPASWVAAALNEMLERNGASFRVASIELTSVTP